MRMESESEVSQSCLTLCETMDYTLPGSTGVGCHFLLQGIFPTQDSNRGFPHRRQTLYRLSNQGSPHEGGVYEGGALTNVISAFVRFTEEFAALSPPVENEMSR